MDWSSCSRELFEWIPERFLSVKDRARLLGYFISDPLLPIKFLQIHPVTGIADITCPTLEALNGVKLKIRWFIANSAFYNYQIWGNVNEGHGIVHIIDDPDLRDVAMLPVEIFRAKATYNHLKNLRSIDGVDIVSIGDLDDEDQVVSIKVKTSSEEAFNECTDSVQKLIMYASSQNTDKPLIALSRSGFSSTLQPFHLPVPYGSKKVLVDDNYLEKLYREFHLVNSLKLDESSRSLEIAASPEVTEKVISKVLGRLSFNKRLPGVRKYRVFLNYLYQDIKVCPETGEASIYLVNTDPSQVRVDFRDLIFEEEPLNILHKVEPGAMDNIFGSFKEKRYDFLGNRNNVCHNLRKRINQGFSMFLDWNNLPALINIEVSVRLGGVSFYVHEFSPSIRVGFPNFQQNAEFSCDLKISRDILVGIFSNKSYSQSDEGEKLFANLSFFDLSSNTRYTATLPVFPINTKIADDDILIARRRAKHIENILIKNGNSITYHNFISSDTDCSPEKLELLKGFVKAAVEGNLHLREGPGTLYFNKLFSVFNVSTVKRVIFIKEEIRVDIDSVSKKTHQRNGQFDEITRVSLSCPNLCAGIKELQECPDNESLRKSVERLYNHLIDRAEEITEVVDLKTANLPVRPFYR